MQGCLLMMLQGVISASSTLTIPVEPPVMPIPPNPLYSMAKISPNFGITLEESSNTLLLSMPLIHAGCKTDIPQQNHVQQGKPNGLYTGPQLLWQSELAMRSTPSSTMVAPSNAWLLVAVPTLEKLSSLPDPVKI